VQRHDTPGKYCTATHKFAATCSNLRGEGGSLDAQSAIWVDSLAKIYRSGGAEVIVFRNVSFQVRRGERLAIIGESGAGKSTLLHLLGGLDRPSAGRIVFRDQDIVSLGDNSLAEFRNRAIGFVWQNPSLLPEFTALENVMMPLLIRGVTPENAARAARSRLEEVGLKTRASHRAGELSGGEQQRVALARALVGTPKVLLADEPTGNLDFRTGDTIMNLLTDLHTSHDLTSVLVTHNLGFASRCDRVLELRKGVLHSPSSMEPQEAGVLQDATRLGGGTYV
jgi:lipoprotein-releasing system ATP-binding protein